MSSLIKQILVVSDEIHDGRTPSDIMLSIGEEFGELATEVAIAKGFKNRPASSDGIVGEALDLIISAMDIIRTVLPDADHQVIEYILESRAETKLVKWKKSKCN